MVDINKIINVKFTRRGKGYDTAEVDAFLDELVDDVRNAEKKIQEREAELEEAQKSIVKALMTAQTAAQNTESEAKSNADAIMENSRAEAQKIISDAETEQQELLESIKKMREFANNYRDAVMRDMNNQLEAFSSSFLSDSVYAQFDMPDGTEDAEVEAADDTNTENGESAQDDGEKKETTELKTGDMGYINLDEIISGLPQSDTELKALIDEIM